MLGTLIERETADALDLTNNVTIEIRTASATMKLFRVVQPYGRRAAMESTFISEHDHAAEAFVRVLEVGCGPCL